MRTQQNPVAAQPVGSNAHVLDEQGFVRHDVPCRRCGYNLRGLAPAGVCPECAAPVSLSLQGNLLRYANPEYVQRLARGARWVALGQSLWAGGLAIVIIAGVALTPLRDKQMVLALLTCVIACCYACAFAGLLMCPLGVWLITAREFVGEVEQKENRHRRLARIYLSVGLSGTVVSFVLSMFAAVSPVVAVAAILTAGFWVVAVLGVRAYFRHLGRICQRIPDWPLDKRVSMQAAVLNMALGVVVFVGFMLQVRYLGRWLFPGGSFPMPTFPIAGMNEYFVYVWWVVWRVALLVACAALFILFFSVLNLHSALGKQLALQAALAREELQRAAAPLPTKATD